jgi:hypothetical protein
MVDGKLKTLLVHRKVSFISNNSLPNIFVKFFLFFSICLHVGLDQGISSAPPSNTGRLPANRTARFDWWNYGHVQLHFDGN